MRVLLALLLAAQPCLGAVVEGVPEGRPSPIAPLAPIAPLVAPPELSAADLPALASPTNIPPAIVESAVSIKAQAQPQAQAATAQKATVAQRLEAVGASIAKVTGFGPGAAGESSSAAAESQIRILQEDLPAGGGDDGTPPPLSPEGKRAIRLMMWGTPAFKLGAEVVTLSLPQLVLKSAGASGGAGAVALLLIVYQAAQAVVGMATPALLRRFPASKVVAGSVAAQAALVATLVGLTVSHAATPWAVLPFYGLLGAAIGVADTARRLIPSLILAHDEAALRDYNARLHRRYETAGVIGSAVGGGLIFLVGPLYAMLVQPPAYLLSAWLFWKVKHPSSTASADEEAASWKDVFRGAARVARDPRLRWVATAMILPQIIHRVFENLLLPVYAKTLLGAGALAAALLTASNLGELGGASFMVKRSARYPGPSAWVRWAALGLVAGWMLPLAGGHLPVALALAVLAPAIFIFSSTWAGSHLSLESETQKTVSRNDQPGVLSFLNGLFIAGTALASFGVGRLLDGLGTGPALVWVCAAFTAVGLMLWTASRKLKR